MPDYAIILAGGKGKRLESRTPKQFLPILGKPMVAHSIQVFRKAIPGIRIILVIPEESQETWKEIERSFLPGEKIQIALGGRERFHSVQNGLSQIANDAIGVVGVHDAARAMIDTETVKRCYDLARGKGSAIPVSSLKDSIRYCTEEGSRAVEREHYCLVQTPQCFSIQLAKEAYSRDFSPEFTDDASVVEALGQPVHLVEGHEENIKLTYPRDMVMAEIIMKSRLQK